MRTFKITYWKWFVVIDMLCVSVYEFTSVWVDRILTGKDLVKNCEKVLSHTLFLHVGGGGGNAFTHAEVEYFPATGNNRNSSNLLENRQHGGNTVTSHLCGLRV